MELTLEEQIKHHQERAQDPELSLEEQLAYQRALTKLHRKHAEQEAQAK